MTKILLMKCMLMLFLISEVCAQSRPVSGKVTDGASGQGLPGVTVLAKGTQTGTSTDVNGNYSLNVPADAKTLVFSFIGYTTVESNIANNSTVNVTLRVDANQLSEVVVVGYGTQTRKEITGSVASVNAREIQNIPVIGPDQALQGRAAGVQVVQASGTPGGGVSVRVRGPASITAGNQPLYVVDGIPINAGNYAQVGVGGQQSNALSDLNPNDIESMEVLKDAAAAAIYGSRASNGVVIITTKRGANQKTKVDLNYYTGFQQPIKTLEPLSGPEYVSLVQEAVGNRYPGLKVGATTYQDLPSLMTGIGLGRLGADPSTFPSTDWQKEIFVNAPISNYDLAFSGGNERTRFRLSGTYFDQAGIILGSGFERFSLRLNLDNNISEKIKIGTSTSFSRSASTRIQNDNNINGVLSAALLMGPHVPVYNPDGTYGKDPLSSVENPVAAANEPTFNLVNGRVLSNVYGEYQILPSLSFRTSFGADYITYREQQFLPTTTNSGRGSNGVGTEGYNSELNLINENTLNYRQSFGADQAHSFTGLLGASYQRSDSESILAAGNTFPGNDIKRLSAAAVKTTATSSGSGYSLVSFFSRLNYSFREKYILSASIRTDGSSRFGLNNRYGVFPAGSAAWRISEEGFLKDRFTWINDLKLRGGYGITGNQEISNFASRALISSGANYNQLAGLAPTQLGYPSLTWEETTQLNLGLDFGFLQDRLVLAVDAYERNTNDLLLGRPLVQASGFSTITQNIGSMMNRGLEFDLKTVNIDNDNFKWTSGFNLAFNKNEITKLAGSPFAAGFASWVEEGQSLGSFRGYRVDKIFQSQEEIDALNTEARTKTGSATAVYQSALTAPGDIKFRDLDGNGVITSADQEILGNGLPKAYGGLNNSLSFRGVDLSFFFQFSYGNKIYNNTKAFAEGMNSVFGQVAAVRDRWTPTNTDTNIPRAVYGDPNNNRRTSDRFVEDGSYVRLKNISLGYNIPTTLVNKVGVRSLRVYAAAQNLLTFTDYSALDPEVSTFGETNTAIGTDFLTFPQAKTFTFGVNVGL